MTWLVATIALSLGALAAGCQPARSPQPAIGSETPAMNAQTPSRAILTPAGDGDLSVRFALTNLTDRALALDTYQPFLQFRMRASAGGTELSVVQPTLDLPVQPVTVTIPASGTIELVTPLRLRFRAGAPPSQERFVWSIAHEPAGVLLTFSLQLPPPFDQPFTTQL